MFIVNNHTPGRSWHYELRGASYDFWQSKNKATETRRRSRESHAKSKVDYVQHIDFHTFEIDQIKRIQRALKISNICRVIAVLNRIDWNVYKYDIINDKSKKYNAVMLVDQEPLCDNHWVDTLEKKESYRPSNPFTDVR